jgi:hypothetical protein
VTSGANDLLELRAQNAVLLEQLAALKKAYDKLLFEHELLKRQVFGPKAERVRHEEAQLPLLTLLNALGRLPGGDDGAAQGTGSDGAGSVNKDGADKDGDARTAEKKKRAAPHGRRKADAEELKEHRLVLEPVERLAPGGELLERVGEEVTSSRCCPPGRKPRCWSSHPSTGPRPASGPR